MVVEVMPGPVAKLSAGEFYETYHGHKCCHLETVHVQLRQAGVAEFAFLVGDSSFDNKHWFFSGFTEKRTQANTPSGFVTEAVNGYDRVLSPPLMVKDVSYWINRECAEHTSAHEHLRLSCLNCAVEESCLVQREVEGLLPQDRFVRDNITESDVLVVDVGGNDIALRPTFGVILNIAWLLFLTPTCFIRFGGPLLAPGLWYFVHMFRIRLRRYIEQLIAKRKPRKVIVCMLYFLDETPGGSWADGVLKRLGYDSNPVKLQTVMRKVFSWGVGQMSIPGTTVIPVPLYEALDGKDSTDYVHRVEPSVTGGRKMAHLITKHIFA